MSSYADGNLSNSSSDSPLNNSINFSNSNGDSQNKRRRHEEETDCYRRDRSDRPEEEFTPQRRDYQAEIQLHQSTRENMSVEEQNQLGSQSISNLSESGADDHKNDTELRLLMESMYVGAIIGKGGETIKRLRDEHGAYLNILKAVDQNQRERVMVVKGPHQNVMNVLDAICAIQIETMNNREKRDHGDDVQNKDSTSLKILVHRTTVGAVIGKGGDTIRNTINATGARVQVTPDVLANSTEKVVVISGNRSQIQAALDKVIEQIKSNPPKSGTKVIPYVPGPTFGGPGFGVGGFEPMPYASPYPPPMAGYPPYGVADQGPMSEQKIAIPSVCAGCVIGKQGAIIRDLRLRSNCSINVEKADPNVANERVVTIKGTTHAIQTAVHLIRQCVEQYKPRANASQNEEY